MVGPLPGKHYGPYQDYIPLVLIQTPVPWYMKRLHKPHRDTQMMYIKGHADNKGDRQ